MTIRARLLSLPAKLDDPTIFRRWLLTLAGVACLCLAPLAAYGALDSRLAASLSGDEEFIANGLFRMLSRPSLNYGFWWYPPLYMEGSALVSFLLTLTGVPLATAVIVGPRLVSILSLVLTATLTGQIAFASTRRGLAGVLAFVLVATTPDLFAFALLAHPDTLQTALVTLSLWPLWRYVETAERRYLWAASAAAGLAFVTKYAGAFVTPVIGLAILWVHAAKQSATTPGGLRRAAFWQDCAKAAAVFFVTTAVAAPSFWWNLKAHVLTMGVHHANVSFGIFTRDLRPGSTWLSYLGDTKLVGGSLLLLIAILVVLVVFTRLRPTATSLGPGPEPLTPLFVYLGFTALYLTFLMWHSRMFEFRYLYPVVPAVILLGVDAGTQLVGLLKRPTVTWAVATLMVIALGPPLGERVGVLQNRVAERVAETTNPCLEVGQWLSRHVAADTSVVYDHYTYVPTGFTRAKASWGMTPAALEKQQATVMLTTEKIRERYRNREDADPWRRGADRFLASFSFYQQLEQGALPEWREIAAFPECHGTRVYLHQQQPLTQVPAFAPAPEPAFIPAADDTP